MCLQDEGFPGSSFGKESTWNAGIPVFNPWFGKISYRRKWQPTPVFLPEQSHGQRGLMGHSPWGHKRVGHNLVTKPQPYKMNGLSSSPFIPPLLSSDTRQQHMFLKSKSDCIFLTCICTDGTIIHRFPNMPPVLSKQRLVGDLHWIEVLIRLRPSLKFLCEQALFAQLTSSQHDAKPFGRMQRSKAVESLAIT